MAGLIHYNVTGQQLATKTFRLAGIGALFVAAQIRRAITEQEFTRVWKPLTPKYLEAKRKKGLSLNIWEATGFLKDNIRAYWSGSKGAFVVGVNPYVKYPETGTKALMVARVMEYGTRNGHVPARPLFRIVSRLFRGVARRTKVLDA